MSCISNDYYFGELDVAFGWAQAPARRAPAAVTGTLDSLRCPEVQGVINFLNDVLKPYLAGIARRTAAPVEFYKYTLRYAARMALATREYSGAFDFVPWARAQMDLEALEAAGIHKSNVSLMIAICFYAFIMTLHGCRGVAVRRQTYAGNVAAMSAFLPSSLESIDTLEAHDGAVLVYGAYFVTNMSIELPDEYMEVVGRLMGEAGVPRSMC